MLKEVGVQAAICFSHFQHAVFEDDFLEVAILCTVQFDKFVRG